MLARLVQILIKEFLQVLRDKRARTLLIGPPIIQMLVFGYAATFEIRQVRTVVLDLDHSPASREFLARFDSSPYFDVQQRLAHRTQLEEAVERGRATIAIQIHPGFAERLGKGESAPVQVIVDATDSNTALIALGYIGQIAERFGQEETARRLDRRMPLEAAGAPRITLERRPWYNPDLRSRWFFVPGVVGSILLIIVTILTAFAVVREREIGTLEQMMVTPIRPWEFILGKTLPFFLIGLFDVALLATFGTLWFRIPFRGEVWVLFGGAVLFILCMLGIGLFISTVSATQQQAMVTAFFFTMPAITFSGFGFPIASMPEPMQWLSYLDPLRYFLIVLRGVYLKGVGLDVLWPQFAAMAALAAVMLSVSILRFHKSLD